jgi:hypothetical protein
VQRQQKELRFLNEWNFKNFKLVFHSSGEMAATKVLAKPSRWEFLMLLRGEKRQREKLEARTAWNLSDFVMEKVLI